MATEIELQKIGPYKFEAKNSQGFTAILDGPKKIGGDEEGLRPMETLLIALAGCSSFDVLHILNKARQDVQDLKIKVAGDRREEIPSIFTKIHLTFIAKGGLSQKQFEKACQLSMEKYCSVANMINKVADITFDCIIDND